MQKNPIVSREEWLAARKALLVKEKEATRLRDKLTAERMALPWVKVDKEYIFDAPGGKKSLADLFDERSQLIIYHFMLGPGWEAGCPSCSLVADHLEATTIHLNHHDITLAAVSRAPLSEISAYKTRMGWSFPWVSSHDSDFNFDFHVSFTKEELEKGPVLYNFARIDASEAFEELPGISVFYRDESGEVFHTYSSYARGVEDLVGAFMILDRMPKGRNETTAMDWVRRHDEYGEASKSSCCDS